jgi:hypothetical protein
VHGRHVERARQVVEDGVEQRLDALVLEGEPQKTGVSLRSSVALRIAALSLSIGISASSRMSSTSSSS